MGHPFCGKWCLVVILSWVKAGWVCRNLSQSYRVNWTLVDYSPYQSGKLESAWPQPILIWTRRHPISSQAYFLIKQNFQINFAIALTYCRWCNLVQMNGITLIKVLLRVWRQQIKSVLSMKFHLYNWQKRKWVKPYTWKKHLYRGGLKRAISN